MHKFSLFSCGLLLAAITSSASAFADSLTFNFSFDSPSGTLTKNQFSGSGQFTTMEVGSTDVYTITGVSGDITEGSNVGNGETEAITKLFAVDGFKGNDNELTFPTGTLDGDGVSFALADGSDVRLYHSNDENLIESSSDGGSSFSPGFAINITEAATSASPVPEPSTLALFGTGILGLAGMARRKFLPQ